MRMLNAECGMMNEMHRRRYAPSQFSIHHSAFSISSIHLQELHEVRQDLVAEPGVAGVVPLGVGADRTLAVGAVDLGQLLAVAGGDCLDAGAVELDVVLEAEQLRLEAERLVLAQ